MKKRTAEMVEALKAEGIRTEEDLNAAIRAEQPLDLTLMLLAPAGDNPIRAAG